MESRHISGSQLRTRKFVFSKTPRDELEHWCGEFDGWIKEMRQQQVDERMAKALEATKLAALAAAKAEAEEAAAAAGA
jgi:hypothetical protein